MTPIGSKAGSSTGLLGGTATPGASSSPALDSPRPSSGSSSTPAFGLLQSNISRHSSTELDLLVLQNAAHVTGLLSSSFISGSESSASTFEKSGFGGQRSGSRVASCSPTTEPYRGGPIPSAQSTGLPGFSSSTAQTHTPAFCATNTPAFGASSAPAFGSTSIQAFGSLGSAFGVRSAPVFHGGGAFVGASGPIVGSSSTPAFSASSTPHAASSALAFGASSTPSFNFGSTQAFGASSTPSFNFGSTQAFAQSSAFGSSSPFGSTATAYGGSQIPTSTFVQSGFGVQGGSRVASFTATTEVDSNPYAQTARFESISAMPNYKDKSHEELRWDDYQLGDKGGPLPGAQSTSLPGFSSSTTWINAFSPPSMFGNSSTNPFSSTTLNAVQFLLLCEVCNFKIQRTCVSYSNLVEILLCVFSLAGSQTLISIFGQSDFRRQRGGSRLASFTATTEADSNPYVQTARFGSISAMPIYKDKSHEELRWDDYQLGDKGGQLPGAQSFSLPGFSSSTTQINAFSPPSMVGNSSTNPFSSTTPNSVQFMPNTSTFPSGPGTPASPAVSSSAFGFGSATSVTVPSMFGSSSSPFGAGSSSPSFENSTPLFSPAPAQATSSSGKTNFGKTVKEKNTRDSPETPKEPVFNCPICMDPLTEEMSTGCGHIFCKQCIEAALSRKAKCPTCRKRVDLRSLRRVFLPAAS